MELLLVGPKLTKWQEIRAHLNRDYDFLDFDYQLLLPEYFVMGDFKERDGKFELSPGGIFYENSRAEVAEYVDGLSANRLKLVRKVTIEKEVLDGILNMGRVFNQAKQGLRERIKTFKDFIVD